MEGNRKRFSKGWFTGLVLGTAAAGGAAVYAVTLPHTFQDGQTASAEQVNANFQALSDAIDGCTVDMVRVGSSCIDTTAKVVTSIPPACQPTGQGCADIGVGEGMGVSFSWGQALAACVNAAKRLARSSEVIAAFNSGAVSMADGDTLYVDAAAARDAGAPSSGTHVSLTGGKFELLGINTPYDEQFPSNVVAFRCAR